MKKKINTLQKIKTYLELGVFLVVAPSMVHKSTTKICDSYKLSYKLCGNAVKKIPVILPNFTQPEPFDYTDKQKINQIKRNTLLSSIGKVPISKLINGNTEDYLLLNAIYKNNQLDEEIEECFYNLLPIIQENPYLDKKRAYYTLYDVKYIQSEPINDYTQAIYNLRDNYIEDFSWKSEEENSQMYTKSHECIHTLFNQNKLNYGSEDDITYITFIIEGVTELLNREYLGNDPYSTHTGLYDHNDSFVYPTYVITVKLLCEIIGSDTVLEAYTKNDMSIIYEALANIKGTVEEAKNLIHNINNLLHEFQDNTGEKLHDDNDVFSELSYYHSRKNETTKFSNTDLDIFTHNLYMLLLLSNNTTLEWIDKYKYYTNELGVPEKAYFCEELKNSSRNKMVEYEDRKLCLNRKVESHKTLLKNKWEKYEYISE